MVTKHCLKKVIFAASMLVSAVGCSDDELASPSPSGSGLCFTVEESDVREDTRSTIGNGSILSSSVTPVETAGRTLYLHACEIAGVGEACLGGDTPVTRGVPVTDMKHYEEFLVSAAFYQEGGWDADSQTANFMYKVPVSQSGSVWSPQSTYYWPGKNYKMRFYAYAPKDAEFELSEQSTSIKGAFIKYEVPADVTRQKDLLVAKSDEYPGDSKNPINLQFKHALTAVKFVVGNDMNAGTIRKVALRNIHSAGKYYIESGETELLTGTGTVKDFERILEKHVDSNPGTAITEDSLTFMLPPQELPDSALLEIVFADDGGEHTLGASLKKTIWNSGTTVVYKISTSSISWDYFLNVSGPDDFNYSGGTRSYSVTSYKQNTQGKELPVAWSTEYSTDNGQNWTEDKPAWLTAFTMSGEGGKEKKFSATVIAQTGIDYSSHTEALQGAPVKGSEITPYNLSNKDGGIEVQNTANCYVVNAPGYYSLPLVYGNAIKNGSTNSSAYKSNATGSVLKNFINHLGNAISDPYIANNSGCDPSKAELVWQDAPSLVSDIRYNPDNNNGNISFKVDQATIRQGNAVIAIKDENDQILWSWHIWVTDEIMNEKTPTVTLTNHDKNTFQMVYIALGWCDACTINYAERICKVKFIAGNQSQIITIKQTAANLTTRVGNCPYYQWGRKDPFQPSEGGSTANKTWYDKDGTSFTTSPARRDLSRGAACIRNYILNPNVMHSDYYADYDYNNLWDANNSTATSYTNNSPVKTIYDPCPFGFRLPAAKAFTGFTWTGGQSNGSNLVYGSWSGDGWNFTVNGKIFFPVTGMRDKTGNVISTSKGQYWTAAPALNQNNLARCGYCLIFTNSMVGPMEGQYRGMAGAVRPSRD